MKKVAIINLSLFLTIVFSSFSSHYDQDITIGEELTISEPSSNSYVYIQFPKNNFILKKGGTLNFKSLVGTKVIVDEIMKSENGETIVKVKKKNGGSFLHSLKTLNIAYNNAIKYAEIIK